MSMLDTVAPHETDFILSNTGPPNVIIEAGVPVVESPTIWHQIQQSMITMKIVR